MTRFAPASARRWKAAGWPTRAVLVGMACAMNSSAAVADGDTGPVDAGTIHIVATDAGFTAPDQVAAGLRHLVYENRGSQVHEAMLVRLPDGMDASGYVDSVRGGALFPAGARDYSGPGLTSPGGSTELWLSIDPGRYILICWNEDHATHVPVHPFVAVAGDTPDAVPPRADVGIKLVDFRFELDRTPVSGEQVLRIETVGPSMHEVDLYRLDEGRSLEDLRRWTKRDPRGAPPGVALGGALDSHDLHHVVWIRQRFEPGRYVLWCEMPLSAAAKIGEDFATHSDAGMVREFEVR